MTLSPEISSSISKLGILFRVQIKLRYLRLKHIPSDLPKSKLDLDREVNISVPKFCCKIRWPGTYNLWPCTHAFCVCHTLCQCAHLHLPWNCLAWATESCDCGGRAPCIRIPMTVHWITQTDRYPFIRSIPLFGQWNKIQPFINLQLTKFPKQASLTSFFFPPPKHRWNHAFFPKHNLSASLGCHHEMVHMGYRQHPISPHYLPPIWNASFKDSVPCCWKVFGLHCYPTQS